MDDELVHQPERERAVGAGQQRDVLVALLGGLGAPRSMQTSLAPWRLAACA